MIAHYLLMHLNSLEQLTIKKVIDDVGISKASLHRFFSKGGYESFKDLITILDEEVKQKKKFNMSSGTDPQHLVQSIIVVC